MQLGPFSILDRNNHGSPSQLDLAGRLNIGPDPTFGEQTRKVEAHLIGFEGDLYGRLVELEFLARLRVHAVAFSSLDDLLAQIRCRHRAKLGWSASVEPA